MRELALQHRRGHGAINREAQQVRLAPLRVHGRLRAKLIAGERRHAPLARALQADDDLEFREAAGAHHGQLPVAQHLHVIGVLALLVGAEEEAAVAAVGGVKHGELGLLVLAEPLAAQTHREELVAEPLHVVRPVLAVCCFSENRNKISERQAGHSLCAWVCGCVHACVRAYTYACVHVCICM